MQDLALLLVTTKKCGQDNRNWGAEVDTNPAQHMLNSLSRSRVYA